jgi:hypothetical protein
VEPCPLRAGTSLALGPEPSVPGTTSASTLQLRTPLAARVSVHIHYSLLSQPSARLSQEHQVHFNVCSCPQVARASRRPRPGFHHHHVEPRIRYDQVGFGVWIRVASAEESGNATNMGSFGCTRIYGGRNGLLGKLECTSRHAPKQCQIDVDV